MKVVTDMGEGYLPVWNLMQSTYSPCPTKIVELGEIYEDAKKLFENYARKVHDSKNLASVEIYVTLMASMDKAEKALRPHKNFWWLARHGLGLN